MIYSLTVTKDETDRYLRKVITRLLTSVDGSYVYDDRSEDESAAIAEAAGATVRVRSEKATAFLDDESKFRSDALRNMVKDMDVQVGDWIIVVDADELLVVDTPLTSLVEVLSMRSYSLKVNEVFDVGELGTTPYIRTDGFWGDIYNPRMFTYDGDTDYKRKIMGCGSVPEKFMKAPILSDVEILHYGYATQEDRVKKYARYFGRPGHSVKHVDSILRKPTLVKWSGAQL